MPSNFSAKEVYDICEYGGFNAFGDFHCPFRREKMLDALVAEQSIKRYSCCPKTYSDGRAVCYRIKTI